MSRFDLEGVRKLKWAYAISAVSFTVSLSLGCGDSATSPEEPMVRTVDTEPSWGPGGEYLVYTHHAQDSEERLLGRYQIWVRTLDSLGTLITEGYEPAVSHDGSKVAFVRDADIYVVTLATQEITRLTSWGSCFSPSWSPDDSTLVYTVYANGSAVPFDSAGVWQTGVNGHPRRQLVQSLGHTGRLSPTGDQLAYVAPIAVSAPYEEIVIMSMSDSQLIRLTTNAATDRSPVWSRDGRSILFARSGQGQGVSLWRYSLSNKSEALVALDAVDASWSDGPEPSILFVRTNMETQRRGLWVMRADGTQPREL